MFFSKVTILSLAASVLAMTTEPLPKLQHMKRALEIQDYSEFQVSGGVGGNALAEVEEAFGIEELEADLEGVSADDLLILKAARETAEDAEVEAGGFNDAIDAAGGTNSEEGIPLQVGKIKNKVLKLRLFVLVLEIEESQGRDDVEEKLEEERTKLARNVELDEENAGEESTPVDFQGTSDPEDRE